MSATAKISLQSDDVKYIQEKARLLRIHSLRATTAAGSGHPTSCLSAAELVAATFFHAMKFDPANPNAIAGDRFVLSPHSISSGDSSDGGDSQVREDWRGRSHWPALFSG